jgi:hypothetical protein
MVISADEVHLAPLHIAPSDPGAGASPGFVVLAMPSTLTGLSGPQNS